MKSVVIVIFQHFGHNNDIYIIMNNFVANETLGTVDTIPKIFLLMGRL